MKFKVELLFNLKRNGIKNVHDEYILDVLFILATTFLSILSIFSIL